MRPPATQPAASPALVRRMASALLLTALALCYLPALTATFGFADDFPQLLEAQTRVKWVQQYWNQAARPVGGFLTEWSFRAAGTIAGLTYLRAAALLLLLLLAWLIYRHLLTLLQEPVLAGLATAFICTQPPFLIHVGWASLWLYMIALLLTYAAYRAIVRGGQGTYGYRAKWLLLALLFLYISLNIYPPSTMFLWFWFGTEAVLADSSPPRLVRRFLLFLVVCGAACILYYGIYRLLGYHSSRAQLSLEIARKVEWFLRTVMTTASRLQWFECVSRWLPLSVWLVIVPGVFLLRKDPAWSVAVKLGVCAAAVVLCYLPLLVVTEFDVPFRTQAALTAYIGGLFFLAILQIMIRLTDRVSIRYLVLCGVVVAGMVKANAILVSHVVLPQSFEYQYLKAALADAVAAHQKAVIVESTLTPKWHWDELRLITSALPDEYRMLSAMATLIVHESWHGPGPEPEDIQVAPHGTNVGPRENTAVIDMQAVMDMLSSE